MTNARASFITALTLAPLLWSSGCGNHPARSADSKQPTVPSSSSPELLMADAMLRPPEQALPLVRKAMDKAPGRTDIVWLYSQLCGQVASCDVAAAESRLRRLDPKNGAIWLGALTRARQGRDVAAENEILEAMSRSERFDIYWNPLVARIALSRGATPAGQPGSIMTDVLTANLNETIGWISSIVTPGFTALGESCSDVRMKNPAIAQRCGAIATALIRGDSYIAEGMGLGIAQRLAPAGSVQAASVAGQIKRSRYQRDTAGRLIAGQVERDKFSLQLIGLMNKLRREQDVFLAVIKWSGQPVEPMG